MTLFDSIESELSTFFVSQGTMFESIVKNLMDRIVQMETRIELVQNQLTTQLNQLATTIVQVDERARLGIAAASKATADSQAQTNDQLTQLSVQLANQSMSMEMEYFLMALSRQMHFVLELFFSPYSHAVVDVIQAKQSAFLSIGDVLTANESILMQLAQQQQQKTLFTQREELPKQLNDTITHQQAQQQAGNVSGIAEMPDKKNEIDQNQEEEHESEHDDHHQTQHELMELSSSSRRTSMKRPERSGSLFSLFQDIHGNGSDRTRPDQSMVLHMRQLLDQELQRVWTTETMKQRILELITVQQTQMYGTLWGSTASGADQTDSSPVPSGPGQVIYDMQQQLSAHQTQLNELMGRTLQTARDDCVHGVSRETLDALQQQMLAYQTTLQAHEQPSPETLTALVQETNAVVDLLQRIIELLSSDANALHSDDGAQLMQSLRSILNVLEDVAAKDPETPRPALVADTLRQMERGTATLLEALEQQQEQYEQAFAIHQTALEKLQAQLNEQKEMDLMLQQRLAVCPSQEETVKIIDTLQQQLQTSSTDVAARMVDTVEELRTKMSSLPSAEVVESLIKSIKAKVDRVELERKLQEAILAQDNVAPLGSLIKSPLRCLSCDQNLPFGQISTGHAHSCHSPQAHSPHRAPSPESHHHPSTAADMSVTKEELLAALSPIRDQRKKQQRQRQERQQLQSNQPPLPLTSPVFHAMAPGNNEMDWKSFNVKRAFINLDDTRNRIPLRRPTLSEQVVYGPAITPGAIQKAQRPGSRIGTSRARPADEYVLMTTTKKDIHDELSRTAASTRPKTAVPHPSPGGEIITRTPTSTVVIRPFAEQKTKENERKPTKRH